MHGYTAFTEIHILNDLPYCVWKFYWKFLHEQEYKRLELIFVNFLLKEIYNFKDIWVFHDRRLSQIIWLAR